MLRLGWFSTGRGEGSRGLVNKVQSSIQRGELEARIEFVFTNRGHGEAEGSDQFIQLVRGYGIPLVAFSSSRFRKEMGGGPFSQHRADFDRQALRLLQRMDIDICVMAGYMLVVSPEICHRFDTINIHPALPGGPKGKWQDVIWKLIETRAKETGAMVHLVTETVDEGPPISYCSFPIIGTGYDMLWDEIEGKNVEQVRVEEGEKNALFKLIRQEGMRHERPLLLETLKAVAEGLIKVSNGQVLDRGVQAIMPILLNGEVEGHLARHLR